MLPQNTPRSTGIPRTSQQVAKPAPVGQSHVSASAGANRAAQDQVVSARQPQARPQAAPAGPPSAPARPQAAKVQLIQRPQGQQRGPASVAGGLASVTVQLLDRPGSEVAAAARAATTGPVVEFSHPQSLLIASLLEQHEDAMRRAGDEESQATARGALDALTRMVNARRAAPAAPAPAHPQPGVTPSADGAPRRIPAPTPASAQAPVVPEVVHPVAAADATPATVADPLAEATRGAHPIHAHTTTVVLGPRDHE